MKIALVSEHASPLATLGGIDAGGQNVHVAALAAMLVRLGHAVTVYTRRDDAALAQRVMMTSGVCVEHIDAGPPVPIPKDEIYRYVRDFAEHLEERFRQDRPAVVHSHFWMSGLAALAAARKLAIPLVHTFHALGIEKRRHQKLDDTSPLQRIAEEARLAREVDRIVATSSAEVFELLRMGAPARALKVVPCGVDVERFTPEGPRELSSEGRLRVVTLSRLVPRKGVDTVIEALASVPGAELQIVGGGEVADLAQDPEVRRLRALAVERRVADRTTFRGRLERDAIPALLRSADVVVCTPWYEPFGIVPLEAMACGVPVVAASVGGLVDTVIDGLTGVHVPPQDADRVAQALDLLRKDAPLRKAMGAHGMERVRGRYSWHRVASDTLKIYASAVGLEATDALRLGT